MKRLILKIIYVLIFQLVIIGIVLAGGYFYLLKFSDPQKLENFSSTQFQHTVNTEQQIMKKFKRTLQMKLRKLFPKVNGH